MSARRTRCCLVSINFLFVLAGLAGLVMGLLLILDSHVAALSIFRSDQQHLALQHSGEYLGLSVVLLALVNLIVAFLGCVGSLCDWNKLLITYAIMLLLLVATELFGITFFSISDAKSRSFLERELDAFLGTYNETSYVFKEHSPVRRLFKVFECCGLKNSSDFLTSYQLVKDSRFRMPNGSFYSYPVACCKDDSAAKLVRQYSVLRINCPATISSQHAYLTGCLSVIQQLLQDYRDHLVIIVTSSVSLQVLLVVLAVCQCLRTDTDSILEQTHVWRFRERPGQLHLRRPLRFSHYKKKRFTDNISLTNSRISTASRVSQSARQVQAFRTSIAKPMAKKSHCTDVRHSFSVPNARSSTSPGATESMLPTALSAKHSADVILSPSKIPR